jgi:DNA replication and repair protein RecF
MGLPRASDLLGRLPSVSFSASDLVIATGEPSDRRQFLDWELAQLYPSYLKNLSVYKRALEHRNALLRQAQDSPVSDEVFESWEEQLAASGSALRSARSEWVEELAFDAAAAHANLGEGEDLGLVYETKDEGLDAETSVRLMSSARGADIARGSTSTGPHRDELVVTVGGQEARHFGSQGQQRTAVIAMKLAVLACAERLFTSPPVLLLDDVFSDLDQSRRNRLMELTLGRGGQVFLTCTEAEQAGADLIERAKVFRVESGQVLES